jgi:hypothetical protein
MARKAPSEKEVEERAAVCSTIVAFMQRAQPGPLLDEVSRVIDDTRRKKNARGLKTLLTGAASLGMIG